MRTLIASIICSAALMAIAVTAVAAPVGGRFDKRYTPAMQEQPQTQAPVVHELHTVIRERDAGRTLAFVLAGTALGLGVVSVAYSAGTRRRLA